MKALSENTENQPEIKPAFTPGPWIAVGDWVEHPSEDVADICTCDPRFLDQEGRREDAEMRANAKLIAAAPDMYEALKAFAAFADGWESRPLSGMDDVIYSIHGGPACGGYDIRLSDCIRARDALRKARGEAV